MATAKKTSKKPAVKTTVKTAAKKAPTKTAAAKATIKKVSGKKILSLESLYKLNLVSALVSAALALVGALLLVPSTAQFVLNYMTADSLAGTGKVVLAPASRVMWEVELGYLLAVIFTLSAIGSLLLATVLKKRYDKAVGNQTSGFRWLFVGISSALLLEFASILAGVQDVATLKLIAALVLGASLLSWLAERENKGAGTKKWLAYAFALVAGSLAWTPLLVSMIGTPVYGYERFSWYVYAFAGVLLLGFIGFAYNLYRQILGEKRWVSYLFAERNYLAGDLVMKTAAVAVIVAALHN